MTDPVPAPPALPAPPSALLQDAALFLDFDGTLVELIDRPDDVRVDPPLARLMEALSRRVDGRLAILTGRPAMAMADLFGGPSFAIAGSHGMEMRGIDGTLTTASRAAGLDEAAAAMRAFAASDPAILIEEKPLGIALHYRAAPHVEDAANALAADLAKAHALRLQPGKMMVEVRTDAGDKGRALEALMATPAMAGKRPLFLGDDHTDEPAFAMARRLGGHGVLIGEPRQTSATHALPSVAATRAWLEQAAGGAAR